MTFKVQTMIGHPTDTKFKLMVSKTIEKFPLEF